MPCLAVGPNRQTIATGSRDDTIRLWDASHGQLIQTLKGHTNDVMSLAFSPTGRTLASASYDRTVRLWDIESGQQLASLVGHSDFVFAVTFHPDGKTLVSGGGDATIRYWDVDSQREIRRLRGQMNVSCVAFAPGGNTLASTAADGNVILRNGFDGSVRRILWMPATDSLYPLRRQSDYVAEIASEQRLP
jgi:WD40 repeat protein